MKLVEDIQFFLGIIGLIVATIVIVTFGCSDYSVVIATNCDNITIMDIETGKTDTERNWWNKSIKENDTINLFQFVVGCGDSIPELHLDVSEDAMIAKVTKPQG